LRHRRIFVLGSANMDLVFALDRLPHAGETRTGGDVALYPGGKGANQACAASKLGGRTTFVARVGDDAFGSRLLASLGEAGVDVGRVAQCERPTGCACIYVLPHGENSIVISPGANAALDAATAVADIEDIEEGDILLAQLETPIQSVQAAFEYARARGAITILDPAPACAVPKALLDATAFITPNETEAALLSGGVDRPMATFEDAARAAERIVALGPRSVILKLGDRGCVFSDGIQRFAVEAFRVDAVDSTAAGDVFNGAFSVGVSEDMPVVDALRFANAAAAISVTRRGAQPSVPVRAEVDAMLGTALATRRKSGG
jgi:ribokinase